MRKAYAAGAGMIIPLRDAASRIGGGGGGSCSNRGSSSNNRHEDASQNNSSNNAGTGGGSPDNKAPRGPVPPELSPPANKHQQADSAGSGGGGAGGFMKNGRIRGKSNGHQQQSQGHAPANGGTGAQQPPMPPDVMSLTAKNHRLAKELSELRVRHREACKKKTRLSMENMKLSSKYRDAMRQVSFLTNKVDYYQKRSEALAKNGIKHSAQAQSQAIMKTSPEAAPAASDTPSSQAADAVQFPPSASPSPTAAASTPSSSLVTPRKSPTLADRDMKAEMDRVDQILAEHAAKARHAASTSTSPAAGGLLASTTTPPLDSSATVPVTPSPAAASGEEEESPLSSSPKSGMQPSLGRFVVEGATKDFDANVEGVAGVDSGPPSPELSSAPEAVEHPAALSTADKETKEDWEPWRGKPVNKSPERPLPHHHHAYFRHSASPNFRFNEEYPGDITASVRSGKAQQLSIERLDEFKEEEELGPEASKLRQPMLSPLSSNLARHLPPSSSMSSIDDFEASFNVDFPDSFSPKGGARDQWARREEIYNPFSYSPGAEYDWSRFSAPAAYTTSTSPSDPPCRDRTSARGKKPSMRTSPEAGPNPIPHFNFLSKSDHMTDPNGMSGSTDPVSTSSRTPLAGSGAFLLHIPPPPSYLPANYTPESSESSSSTAYLTPPRAVLVNYNPAKYEVMATTITSDGPHDQPTRPEKAQCEATRVRRDKVLQPRLASVPLSSPPPVLAPSSPAPAPSPPEGRRTVKALDPRSREAILLSTRERMSSAESSPLWASAAAAAAGQRASGISPPSLSRYVVALPDYLRQSKSLSSSSTTSLLLLPPPPPENRPNLAASVLWGGRDRPHGGPCGGGDDDSDGGDIPLRSSLAKGLPEGGGPGRAPLGTVVLVDPQRSPPSPQPAAAGPGACGGTMAITPSKAGTAMTRRQPPQQQP